MNTPDAAFNFDSYKINKFTYTDPTEGQINLFIDFNPSGVYHQTGGLFTLFLEVKVLYGEKNENELLSISLIANFKFKEPLELKDIPAYFYKNSIAIVYPYIRSFVNTLTSLANVKPLMLGLLNLSSLEEVLINNTIEL